jgi:hypothetical protein
LTALNGDFGNARWSVLKLFRSCISIHSHVHDSTSKPNDTTQANAATCHPFPQT